MAKKIEKKPLGRPRLDPSEKKGDLLQVRMPPGLIASLKKATKAQGLAISALVRELLEAWLSKHGDPPRKRST